MCPDPLHLNIPLQTVTSADLKTVSAFSYILHHRYLSRYMIYSVHRSGTI